MAVHPQGHIHRDVMVDERADVRRPFGLAQALSIVFGIAATVTGGVALARTGWDEIRQSVTVGPWEMTGILGLFLVGIGIIALLSSADPASARGFDYAGGTVLIAGSLIMLIAEIDALSSDPMTAITLLLAGIVLLGAGLVSSRMTIEERSTVIER